jgi:recombination protein RecA
VKLKSSNTESKSKKIKASKSENTAPKPSDKVKALADLMSTVSKNHGDGSLMLMGENPTKKVGVISSGSVSIDLAFGIGGYPRGRIVEIYGPESSGKTTLTLHAIAECQRQGGVAAFIDAEHALDLDYASKVGINTDTLLFSQPDYGEQALDIVEDIVRANVVDLVVIDSVAALTPKAEIEGNMEKNHVGLQARMMSQALRKLTAVVSKTDTCLMFINQTRQKIGVMFGNPETTPGGNALKFYCSIRASIHRSASIKKGDDVVGNKVRIKVVKNKLAPPFKQVYVDIVFGKGIDHLGDIVDVSVERGLIDKSGAWFKYNGESIGQGKAGVVKYLEDNKDIANLLESILREELTTTP